MSKISRDGTVDEPASLTVSKPVPKPTIASLNPNFNSSNNFNSQNT
jgi:hypothetical protein